MWFRSRMSKTAAFILVTAAVLALAYLSPYPAWVIITFLVACLLWHQVNAGRLLGWLENPGDKTPASFGNWSEIYTRVARLESESRRRGEKVSTMIEDFQLMADVFPDATLLIDENNLLRWFNRAAGRLFILDAASHKGKPVERRVRIPGFADWLSQTVSGQAQFKKTKSGSADTWLECSLIEIRDGQRLIIFRDITDVLTAEQVRRDFVTNVSHELRTPLTVMLGYLELFLDQPPEGLSDAMERMHGQAVQMQLMLNDFLELSRLQSLESKTQDVEICVPGILADLRKQAEEISRGKHEIDFEIHSKLYLRGDPEDIESAFRNLVINALKYTPEGGAITVRWHENHGRPRFEVADSGIGIPAREIPRLTERFFRVGSDRGRKTGGTGLGLSIVKQVLNSHQADLLIESDYGAGSTFCCEFPPERRIVR